MKRALSLPLSEAEMQEPWRIIVDRDERAGMEFLVWHVRPRLVEAMEGG